MLGLLSPRILIGLKLVPYLKAKVEEWEENSKSVSILVTGKTGTGKSTLINGIVGKEGAVQGNKLDPETSEVTAYAFKEGDITVNAFDSPGLQDGTQNERKYLADMKAKRSDVDLVIYCIRMSEDRVPEAGPDVRANETFRHEMWKNTVFLLTFANDVMASAEYEVGDEPSDQQKYFNKQLQDWQSLMRDHLLTAVRVPKEIVEGIVIIPAGHRNEPMLPDSASSVGESHWLSRVWLKALASTKPRAQLALIKLNLHCLHTREEEYRSDKDTERELISQHSLIFEEKGAEIGKALGIPIGESLGAFAGLLAGSESFLDSLVIHLAIKARLIKPEEVEKPSKG